MLAAGRCQAGVQAINTSYYHNSINVPVPQWNVTTTWGSNGVLMRFDNVIMAFWVLSQVEKRRGGARGEGRSCHPSDGV